MSTGDEHRVNSWPMNGESLTPDHLGRSDALRTLLPQVPDSRSWTPGEESASQSLNAGLLCLMLPLDLPDWELESTQYVSSAEDFFLASRASVKGQLRELPGSPTPDTWKWPESVLIAESRRPADDDRPAFFGASSMSLDDEPREEPLVGRFGSSSSLWSCPGLGLVFVHEVVLPLASLTAAEIEELATRPMDMLAELPDRMGDVFSGQDLPHEIADQLLKDLRVKSTLATRGRPEPEFLLVAAAAAAPASRVVMGVARASGETLYRSLSASDARQWESLDTDSPSLGDAYRAWLFHRAQPGNYPLRQRDVLAVQELLIPHLDLDGGPEADNTLETWPDGDRWIPGLDWYRLVSPPPSDLVDCARAAGIFDAQAGDWDDFEEISDHQESGRRIPFIRLPHVNSAACNAWSPPILRADGRVLLLDLDAMSVYHDYRYQHEGGGWLIKTLPLVAYLGQQARDFWELNDLVDEVLGKPGDSEQALERSSRLTKLLLRRMRRRQLESTLTNESDFTEWGQPEQLRQALAMALIAGRNDQILPRPEDSRENYEEPLQIVDRSVATQVQLGQQKLALEQRDLALRQQELAHDQRQIAIEQQRLARNQQELEANAAAADRAKQERLREGTTVASVALGGATFIGLSAALAAIPGENSDTLLQPVLRALFMTLTGAFVLALIALVIWSAIRNNPKRRNAASIAKWVGVVALAGSFGLAGAGALTSIRSWPLLLVALLLALVGLFLLLLGWRTDSMSAEQGSELHDEDQGRSDR